MLLQHSLVLLTFDDGRNYVAGGSFSSTSWALTLRNSKQSGFEMGMLGPSLSIFVASQSVVVTPCARQVAFAIQGRHGSALTCNRQSITCESSALIHSMRGATGVSLPSLYDGNNRKQQLGPRGSESYFVNAQGLKIATYFWPSETSSNTKAVVIAVHGHGAHTQNEWLKRQVS